ncbi:putative conserved membrane protein [Mycobacterium kansasii]|uniref:Putative conserved membrane protein n=1 Tax=Mycobacterium kansasii TaxID=1768 RepID=A0A1V3WLV9_MYCKA|nr:putative conserved membrane protein [Mycobacterium kansasii]
MGRLVARGLLIALVIPPLFTDSDGRGLHDRLTGTAVVRR